jgi:hypothetical protein
MHVKWAPLTTAMASKGLAGAPAQSTCRSKPMTTVEIANTLVALCKQGKNLEAKALYAQEAVSVEAFVPPGMDRVSRGLAAIQAKGAWWGENHEIHSATVAGPWPLDDRFIVGFKFDVTNKPSGRRMTMEEMGLYTVANGKIVREEFFYNAGAQG